MKRERRPSNQSSEDFLTPWARREEGRKRLEPPSLIALLPILLCFNFTQMLSVRLQIREAVLFARSLGGGKWWSWDFTWAGVQGWVLPCPACRSLPSRSRAPLGAKAIRTGSTGRVLSDPACPQHDAHGLFKVSATPASLADPDTIRASSPHAQTCTTTTCSHS